MARSACPAVRTLDLALRSSIPFLANPYQDVTKKVPRLQTGGNPRHQMGVCLDIILFQEAWRYDKSVDSAQEKKLAENLVQAFVDLKDEMKWTEIILQDRLFWEPEYYTPYTQDRAHYTHIHIDWMTNSLKGKGKSEDEIIKNSPQAGTDSFAAKLIPKLDAINQGLNNGTLANITLSGIKKVLSPSMNPVGVWEVKVDKWTWIYDFNADGNVTWRDPWNGENGKGKWKVSAGAITFKWIDSTTTESWFLPIKPTAQTGTTTMQKKTYKVAAVRK